MIPRANPDDTLLNEAVDLAARMNFRQLLIFQASLSEHILNCYSYSELQRDLKLEREAKNEPSH